MGVLDVQPVHSEQKFSLKIISHLGMASRKSIQEQVIVTQHFDTRHFCGVHSAFLISLTQICMIS